MSNKRAVLVEGLYLDVPGADMEMIDRLYGQGKKGPAIAAMMRAIREHWVFLHEEVERLKGAGKARVSRQDDIPRIQLF